MKDTVGILKAVVHKLASIESKMAKQDDVDDIHEQLFNQNEQLIKLQTDVTELKMRLETHHLENINSDDVLLRSILDRQAASYK